MVVVGKRKFVVVVVDNINIAFKHRKRKKINFSCWYKETLLDS